MRQYKHIKRETFALKGTLTGTLKGTLKRQYNETFVLQKVQGTIQT